MAKILCIEDEHTLRRCIVEELEDAGYETIEAADGEQGLEAIRTERPDLVISDIRMPKMDGHMLLQTLRKRHPEHDELPFVFLSALGDRDAVIEGRRLGADAYLTKPVDYEMLLVEVRSRLAQVARMAKHKDEELVRLYKAMSRTPAAESPPAGAGTPPAAPPKLALAQLHTRSGQPCPLYLCTAELGARVDRPQAQGSTGLLEQDLQLLRVAALTVKSDLEAGNPRLLVIDIHENTVWQDKLFQKWQAACTALPKEVRHELGVRVVGLQGARILAQASGLARQLSGLTRLQVVEVDRHGLEILAGMALVFRFVSIDGALLAESSAPVLARARSHIAALHAKGAKVILRNCTTSELRKLNQELAGDFHC